MEFTAEDIQKQQFHIRFRGFDVEEVDSFLEQVGENYLLLSKEKQEMEDKVNQLEQQLSEFRDREKTFQNAILATQKVADEIEEKSRGEAKKRLQETREEAEKIMGEARTEAASLKKQVAELQETRNRIKRELKDFLQSYLDLVDEKPSGESAGPESPGSATESPAFQRQQEETKTVGADISERQAQADDEEDSSLYEKIDLPEDLDLPGIADSREDRSDTDEEDIVTEPISSWEEERQEEEINPALDGKALFNLEDPIDYEPEPAVIIDDDSTGDAQKRKK